MAINEVEGRSGLPEEQQAEVTGGSAGAALRELLEMVLLTLVLFFFMRAVLINFRISGTSMLPNLHDGEYVFVYRLAYLRHPPQRGDIIVFRHPLNQERTLVKRVIGLPGETVSVHNGEVYINGQPLPEPYVLASPTYTAPPVTVGKNEVYVLGDNRNNSSDSHAWGLLRQDLIVGKAVWRFWPPARFGPVPHVRYPSFSAQPVESRVLEPVTGLAGHFVASGEALVRCRTVVEGRS